MSASDWAERTVRMVLDGAGVTIGGSATHDIQVHDERFYRRVALGGSLGLAESYMDGDWDCERLDELITAVFSSDAWRPSLRTAPAMAGLAFEQVKGAITNRQTRRGSEEIVARHYDNDVRLFESFLDPYNQYTCGWFENTNDLTKAQERKLELICRKLHLEPGMRLLDIGCGWGGLARYAAERHGVEVVGITISRPQAAYARELTAGLPVEILEMDYRDLASVGEVDRVTTVGMIEHVGHKNYATMMSIVSQILAPDGLWLLHTIGRNTSARATDPFIGKYIFANSVIPSVSQLAKAWEGKLILHDQHNFGPHYEPTLVSWYRNLLENLDELRAGAEDPSRYDDRFVRMYSFYFLSSAAAFRTRRLHLWQFILSGFDYAGDYPAVRTVLDPAGACPVSARPAPTSDGV